MLCRFSTGFIDLPDGKGARFGHYLWDIMHVE